MRPHVLPAALFIALACCASAPAAAPSAPTYVIHAGRLIDGVGDKVRGPSTLIVEDGKIRAIEDGHRRPAKGQRVIDLSKHTVLPGLIDAHTHLSFQLSDKSYSERFFMDPAEYALRGGHFAERTLMAGFTTVRDLGDRDRVTIALKKAITKGWVVGPRIFTAGKSLATTGGHGDPTNGLNLTLTGDPGPDVGVVNGPRDVWKAVRQRYKEGSDVIKLTATGGVLSLAKSGHNPQFTVEELEAVVAAAKDYGFTVAVHAHGAEGMKRALRAGVDSIEHGTYMDDEVIALLKAKGAYYVPTISAGEWVAAKAKIDGYFPEVVRPKAAKIGAEISSTFAKAYKAGVNIAFGTDCGVSPHGTNGQEFIFMVEAGMPAMAAIQSATREGAKLLRVDDRLGTLEAGKIADIIAVEGNPVEDIKAMLEVRFVMKDGTVFKRE